MSFYRWLILPLGILPVEKAMACLSDADIEILGQMSYTHKASSTWEIEGQNPYRTNNGYNDLAIKYSNHCDLSDDKLKLNIGLYGLVYAPYQDTGKFEEDDKQVKLLLDQFNLSYSVSDTVNVDVGKIKNKNGLIYLKSPSDLLSNYYAGFKPTQIYDPALKSAYHESFWGIVVAQDTDNYSLSLTASPQLTHVDQRYISSTNWSALERSNTNDRYLLKYTDHRFEQHTPSLSVLLGSSKSIALSDSYNITQQLTFNAELALHQKQQWRHLSESNVEKLQNYIFPEELYRIKNKKGMELALGMQYTSDRFSQFGLEYYYQSEGYSRKQWRSQTNLIHFLNQKTNYAPLDKAFDSYKYLMASEIYNISSKGNLQGKHYINGYASISAAEQKSFKPYFVMNMSDKSLTTGMTYSQSLNIKQQQLEVYTGVYASLGKKNSEFGMFGKTVGSYVGFNYHF